jgi:hypothetical protein
LLPVLLQHLVATCLTGSLFLAFTRLANWLRTGVVVLRLSSLFDFSGALGVIPE